MLYNVALALKPRRRASAADRARRHRCAALKHKQIEARCRAGRNGMHRALNSEERRTPLVRRQVPASMRLVAATLGAQAAAAHLGGAQHQQLMSYRAPLSTRHAYTVVGRRAGGAPTQISASRHHQRRAATFTRDLSSESALRPSGVAAGDAGRARCMRMGLHGCGACAQPQEGGATPGAGAPRSVSEAMQAPQRCTAGARHPLWFGARRLHAGLAPAGVRGGGGGRRRGCCYLGVVQHKRLKCCRGAWSALHTPRLHPCGAPGRRRGASELPVRLVLACRRPTCVSPAWQQ